MIEIKNYSYEATLYAAVGQQVLEVASNNRALRALSEPVKKVSFSNA